jgi:putative redox protein
MSSETPQGNAPGTATAAPAEKPPLNIELEWRGDLRFQGEIDGRPSLILDSDAKDGVSPMQASLILDSDAKDGVSPMQALAFAVAGCMGMDLVHILTKARNVPRAVRASFTGRRPLEPPSRFTAIALHFVIDGDAPDEQVQRAIQLSRDKYCSVWNSMNPDIDFNVTFTVNRSTPAAQPPPVD